MFPCVHSLIFGKGKKICAFAEFSLQDACGICTANSKHAPSLSDLFLKQPLKNQKAQEK